MPFPGIALLGRIECRSDQDIVVAFQRDDRAAIVEQAEQMLREQRGVPGDSFAVLQSELVRSQR